LKPSWFGAFLVWSLPGLEPLQPTGKGKVERKEGGKEGRKGRREGRKEGGKEGRKGGKEGRKEGGKEGNKKKTLG